jgi:protein SCO1/2
MVYTNCATVCPRITEDLKAIERGLPADARRRVTFALFSLDALRDTPEALRRFAVERGLAGPGWRLFSGSDDGVRTMAALLGIKYAAAPSGEIAHSALIVVVDAGGVVRHRQIGLPDGPAPVVRAVVAGNHSIQGTSGQ